MVTKKYVRALVLSKAYDKVSVQCLFNKLLDRGTPVYLAIFLAKWYSCQKMIVKWNTHCFSLITLEMKNDRERVCLHLISIST